MEHIPALLPQVPLLIKTTRTNQKKLTIIYPNPTAF
jgi:hypothetical protein